MKKVCKLYVSPNGDRWYLVFDPPAEVFVEHELEVDVIDAARVRTDSCS